MLTKQGLGQLRIDKKYPRILSLGRNGVLNCRRLIRLELTRPMNLCLYGFGMTRRRLVQRHFVLIIVSVARQSTAKHATIYDL